MNRSNQIELQAEPALLVALSTDEDTKALHRADDMLDMDAYCRMKTVDMPFLTAQSLTRPGLERQVCLCMVVLHALVNLIEQARNVTRELIAVGFMQR